MKKTITLLALLLITMLGFSQSFVMINVENQQETENLFNNENLKIHYYNDNFVFATAKTVDENMILLDSEAFLDNDVYTLVYCPQAEQQNYLDDGKALLQTDNFVLVKGTAMPYKNDGAVAIFNKEAKMAVAHRDFPVVTVENPTIREMMNQVNMDSLEATVQHLQDYQSRMWNSTNAYAASDWIASRMTALGLEVEQQPFNVSSWAGSGAAAPNVIGIQRGTVYPDVYVVCGSHFDSFSYDALYSGGTCPGADDNATGVATVLETARIMSQYEFDYSIIYCTFGCEELGLYGSEAYASRCQQQGMQILGYFNNDMNGYLYGDVIHIHCIYPNSVAPIGDYYMNVGSVYFPELPIEHKILTGGDSDHTSFNNHGYLGIFPFEDVDHDSPYIHTQNDLIGPSVNSFAMVQQFCQMNIGCLAEIAHPAGSPVISCNPVSIFVIDYPFTGDYSLLNLKWQEPEAGSTGTLVGYKLYRDNELIAETNDFMYIDTISENITAEYYVTAVYDDGCEAESETLICQSLLDVPEIDAVDDEIVRYEVYDLMGRRITEPESGIYIVKYITRNGNEITKKIVK